jgi:TonB family protein
MKTFLAIILSITFTYAQTAKEKTIAYFDKKWQITKDQSTASYYRTVESFKEKYIVRQYFISGEIQMIAECAHYKPEVVYDGKRTTFYENGNTRTVEYFRNSEAIGTHESFYSDGKTQKRITFIKGKKVIDHFYTPEGEDLLADGSAIVQDSVFGKTCAFREIVDHKEVSEFYVENSDTIYLQCDQRLDYKGGMQRFANDVITEVEYPTIAKELKLEGVVYILIRIAKNGNISKAVVVRGFDHSCNAEALRVVKGLDFWIAAQHNKKPVISEVLVPVEYRLKGKSDLNLLMAIGRELLRIGLGAL